MTQQQPKPEEVLGMIQGLASAMQTSFDAQKATTKQVTEIANSLKDLAEAQSKPSVPQGLRLPPVYTLQHLKAIHNTISVDFWSTSRVSFRHQLFHHAFTLHISNNSVSQM